MTTGLRPPRRNRRGTNEEVSAPAPQPPAVKEKAPAGSEKAPAGGAAALQVPQSTSGAATIVESHVLLGVAHELLIIHNNRLYRLRETINGKLILTA